MTPDDRTVHASSDDGTEIVRYDKAGRWYVESGNTRKPVTVNRAAHHAVDWGYAIHFGRPGGRVFDRAVRRYGFGA